MVVIKVCLQQRIKITGLGINLIIFTVSNIFKTYWMSFKSFPLLWVHCFKIKSLPTVHHQWIHDDLIHHSFFILRWLLIYNLILIYIYWYKVQAHFIASLNFYHSIKSKFLTSNLHYLPTTKPSKLLFNGNPFTNTNSKH